MKNGDLVRAWDSSPAMAIVARYVRQSGQLHEVIPQSGYFKGLRVEFMHVAPMTDGEIKELFSFTGFIRGVGK